MDAELVSNNHFDEDGLVGVFTLLEPGTALGLRELLIDTARAGDVATYRDRRAARARTPRRQARRELMVRPDTARLSPRFSRVTGSRR